MNLCATLKVLKNFENLLLRAISTCIREDFIFCFYYLGMFFACASGISVILFFAASVA